jgi:hypothetical protein
VLPGWVWGVLDIWAACRPPSPMGGHQQLLPFGAGAAEQPAGLSDALAIIDQLTAPPRPATQDAP